mgnify:CR=1 FL=1
MPLTGWEAIEAAKDGTLALHKYADPTEEARCNISEDEAIAVAVEDPSLIYASPTHR